MLQHLHNREYGKYPSFNRAINANSYTMLIGDYTCIAEINLHKLFLYHVSV